VLALVSEKTGYPAEVLDLNLDLEADLGIDTVNRPSCWLRSAASTASPAARICGSRLQYTLRK